MDLFEDFPILLRFFKNFILKNFLCYSIKNHENISYSCYRVDVPMHITVVPGNTVAGEISEYGRSKNRIRKW